MTTRSERERRYGLAPGDYELLAERFDGKCWICKGDQVEGRQLAIDHDHETLTVRGLLCGRCNIMLGYARDSSTFLRAAADYLDSSRGMFADGCQPCMREDRDPWRFPPAIVVKSEGGWTRFGYQCPLHGRWTCGWATGGTMWMNFP